MASPIPDPNALRRDRKDDASWTTLPSKVDVKLPAWPLVGQTEREIELWEAIWKRPQALLWEQNSQQIEVALYVRRLGEVEVLGATASMHTLLQRLMESLLLTLPSMYKSHVKIAVDEIKGRTSKKGAAKVTATGSSAKDRFKVLSNGGA